MSGIGAIGSSTALSPYYRQAYYLAHISAARSAAANPAQPNQPVEPVSPVRRVSPDTPVRIPVPFQERRLPTVDDLNNASEHLVRMRIQYAENDSYPEEATQVAF